MEANLVDPVILDIFEGDLKALDEKAQIDGISDFYRERMTRLLQVRRELTRGLVDPLLYLTPEQKESGVTIRSQVSYLERPWGVWGWTITSSVFSDADMFHMNSDDDDQEDFEFDLGVGPNNTDLVKVTCADVIFKTPYLKDGEIHTSFSATCEHDFFDNHSERDWSVTFQKWHFKLRLEKKIGFWSPWFPLLVAMVQQEETNEENPMSFSEEISKPCKKGTWAAEVDLGLTLHVRNSHNPMATWRGRNVMTSAMRKTQHFESCEEEDS